MEYEMKTRNLKKMCSVIHPNEVYYTSPEWESRDIDGITFILVSKSKEVNRDSLKYIRKDSLRQIKV